VTRFVCIVGGRRQLRDAAARERLPTSASHAAGTPPASRWPFVREVLPADPGGTSPAVLIPDLHLAFPAGQTPGTRLVLTQSTYQLQRWVDWLEKKPDVTVVAHASRGALSRGAPEAFARRGPWSRIERIDLDGDEEDDPGAHADDLMLAFADQDAGRRAETFARAADAARTSPALHLAAASARMELQQLDVAQQAIERSLALVQDWEAPWFEYGKLWLRADDLERAAERFAEAARLMPSFSAALSNLGAALAEIDQHDAAIAALRQALRHDPAGHPILNNLAVIYREQGRLDEAVDAGRQVIGLAPDFVFGYYNLGHALLLQGRYEEARDAYAEGQHRDPQKNLVQACRLAVARAAAGETGRALAELTAIAERLPDERRAEVLGEAESTLEAILEAGTPEVATMLDAVRLLRYST
jgi:tetratricopeptide (TPR) repeat protein